MRTLLLEYKLFSFTLLGILGAFLIRILMGLFNTPSELDIFAHFALVASGAPLVLLLLTRYRLLPQMHMKRHFIVVATLLGVCVEVLWEIAEFCIDIVFGLSWQVSNADTMTDIVLGVIGASIGAAVFVRLYALKTL